MSFLAHPWHFALLSLEERTAQEGWADSAACDRYRTKGKFGASCDLVWKQQDGEFSCDGAGGTGQVKVPPGALSLPHEQPQKDTEEESGGSEHFPATQVVLSLVPQAFLCSSVALAFTLG